MNQKGIFGWRNPLKYWPNKRFRLYYSEFLELRWRKTTTKNSNSNNNTNRIPFCSVARIKTPDDPSNGQVPFQAEAKHEIRSTGWWKSSGREPCWCYLLNAGNGFSYCDPFIMIDLIWCHTINIATFTSPHFAACAGRVSERVCVCEISFCIF